MVVVVVGHRIEALEQPMPREPAGDHFVAGVASNIDHGIVGQIGQQHDRLERKKYDNQHETAELQDRFCGLEGENRPWRGTNRFVVPGMKILEHWPPMHKAV